MPKDWTVTLNRADVYSVKTMTEGRDVVAVRLGDGKSLAHDRGRKHVEARRAGRSPAKWRACRSRCRSRGKSDIYRIVHRGATASISVRRPRVAALAHHMLVKPPPDTSKFLLCPMPGLVVSIAAQVGQDVKAGETLAVVEAMKMENVLRAERDGVIKRIAAKAGDSLPVDAVILEFE